MKTKEETSDYHRAYRANHREELLVKKAAYYKKNREEIRAKARLNREEILAQKRRYRAVNRDRLRLDEKKWRLQNKNKIRLQNAASYKKDIGKSRLKNKTYQAANKDLISSKKREGFKSLSNQYIKSAINSITGLPFKSIPPLLVEIKRAHLELKRLIKNHEKAN